LRATAGGVSDAGAIYLWAGGAGLTGTVAATAVLTAPGAGASAHLGADFAGAARMTDVTGDGKTDVVAAVSTATVGGVAGAGSIYVWNGGATLTGAKSADATLT